MSDTLKAKLRLLFVGAFNGGAGHGVSRLTGPEFITRRDQIVDECMTAAEALLSEAEAPRVADLDDVASDLWQELCEGDGAHSEQLDKALILKHLRRVAPPVAAAPAPPQTCATCRHHDSQKLECGRSVVRPIHHSFFHEWGCTLHEPAPAAGDTGKETR